MKLIPLSVAFFLCLSASLPSAVAQTDSTPTPPTPTSAPAAPGVPHAGGRHHIAIRGAIMALERAKTELQAASHDFGGHREEAIAACDNAIAQLKLALQYASQNTSPSPTSPPSP
jgi:hypothetical protein